MLMLCQEGREKISLKPEDAQYRDLSKTDIESHIPQ